MRMFRVSPRRPTAIQSEPSTFSRAFIAAATLALPLASRAADATATPSQPDAAAAAAPKSAENVPSYLLRLGRTGGFYSPFAFLVDKKARALAVWKQAEAGGWEKVAEYPADLGKKEGEKTRRNDHRTPEGIYFLRDRLEGPSLDFNQYGKRAFTTDYPNFFDRQEGKTGSGIWLHAVPDQTPLTRGSRGCVVVRNDAILELSKFVDLGKTPVVIVDRIEYSKPKDAADRFQQIESDIEAWRRAWEAKDIESYISYYGASFRAQRMGRGEWKAYKSRLAETYKQMTIKLSRPYVVAYKDRAVARFMQDYASDGHQDFGEKTLYLKKENGRFRIVGEDWAADSSGLAKEEMSIGSPTPAGATAASSASPAQRPSTGAGLCAAGAAACQAHASVE